MQVNHTVSEAITREFGFEVGQVFILTEKDWQFKHPPGKSKVALMGLAIDQHIKHVLAMSGLPVNTPLNKYAPYDLEYKGLFFDIKSFSKSSISISDAEIVYADGAVDKGSDLVYLLFEQGESDSFTYRGAIQYSKLCLHNKLRESQYSGMYFTLNDSEVRSHIFE